MDVNSIYASMLAEEHQKIHSNKVKPGEQHVHSAGSGVVRSAEIAHAYAASASSLESHNRHAKGALPSKEQRSVVPVAQVYRRSSKGDKGDATASHLAESNRAINLGDNDATAALLRQVLSGSVLAGEVEPIWLQEKSDAAADLHPEPFTLKEFDTAELLMHRLKRYLNMISTAEENVNTRKAAMSYIAKTLFGVDLSVELLDVVASQDGLRMHIMTTDASRKTVSLHIEQASHEGLVLSDTFPLLCKTLCRRFVDASEAIRIGAIQTIIAFVGTGIAAKHLPAQISYIVTALSDVASSAHVFDFDKRTFAADADALAAYQRGKVIDAQQGMLATHDSDLYGSGSKESSEVVRLVVSKCLRTLVMDAMHRATLPILDAYWQDIFMLAHTLSIDASPEVRIDGCTLLELLVAAIPPYGMQVAKFFATGLVKSLMHVGLVHRLARVRIATLAAVDALVACPDEARLRGAGSEAILALLGARDANVIPVSAFYRADTAINYFAKLVVDPNTAARHRFVQMISHWMTSLEDKHEWWSRLLPYLLSSMGDDTGALEEGIPVNAACICSPVVGGPSFTPEQLRQSAARMSIAELCTATLNTLGAEHEVLHMDALLPHLQAGVDGDPEVAYHRPLPAPLTCRPRLGTRLFVRANCTRFIKAVLSEIADYEPFGDSWAALSGIDTRVRAAELLVHLQAFMEESITQDVHLLVSALVGGIHDFGDLSCCGRVGEASASLPRGSISSVMAGCARLLGRFLHPRAYLPALLSYVTGDAGIARWRTVPTDVIGHSRELQAACHVLWLALSETTPGRILECLPILMTAMSSEGALNVVQAAASKWMSKDAPAPSLLFHYMLVCFIGIRTASMDARAAAEVAGHVRKVQAFGFQLIGRALGVQSMKEFTARIGAVDLLHELNCVPKAVLRDSLQHVSLLSLPVEISAIGVLCEKSANGANICELLHKYSNLNLLDALETYPEALVWQSSAAAHASLLACYHPDVISLAGSDGLWQATQYAIDLLDTYISSFAEKVTLTTPTDLLQLVLHTDITVAQAMVPAPHNCRDALRAVCTAILQPAFDCLCARPELLASLAHDLSQRILQLWGPITTISREGQSVSTCALALVDTDGFLCTFLLNLVVHVMNTVPSAVDVPLPRPVLLTWAGQSLNQSVDHPSPTASYFVVNRGRGLPHVRQHEENQLNSLRAISTLLGSSPEIVTSSGLPVVLKVLEMSSSGFTNALVYRLLAALEGVCNLVRSDDEADGLLRCLVQCHGVTPTLAMEEEDVLQLNCQACYYQYAAKVCAEHPLTCGDVLRELRSKPGLSAATEAFLNDLSSHCDLVVQLQHRE